MQRKIEFCNGEHYHVFNRGADKRTTFIQPFDYERFLFYLYTCNDSRPLVMSYRGLASVPPTPSREPYVHLRCFCLISNHFHLLLQQRVDLGIPKFMQKLSTAYTMYFNRKYDRSGVLFQGPFKAIHIEGENYFTHLSRYIHLNPLDLTQPRWREGKIKRPDATHQFLLTYPWTSYSDYVGHERHARLLDASLLRELIPSPQRYRKFVMGWAAKDALGIPQFALAS